MLLVERNTACRNALAFSQLPSGTPGCHGCYGFAILVVEVVGDAKILVVAEQKVWCIGDQLHEVARYQAPNDR